MAKKTKQAKKNLKFARGRVDKAQSKMIQANAKAIADLKGNIELKYNLFSGSNEDVSFPDMTTTGGRQTNILPVPIGVNRGLGDMERIGDSLAVKQIQFRYSLSLRNSAIAGADEYNHIRVMMFWDTIPYEVITPVGGSQALNRPEWQQVLQTMLVGLGQEPRLMHLSTKDNDLGSRFKVIYDQVHTLSSNGNTSTGIGMGSRAVTNDVKFLKNYVGHRIQYVSGSDVPVNRQLYLAFISDSTVISHPRIDYFIKTQYQDI